MNTDIRQQIQAALRAFSGSDLRAASIGLLNTLGYQSEKTLELDNTPDAFLAEFGKRDRKFRKNKALFERWKSVEFLFQITDDEVRNSGTQGKLFDSGYDHGNYQSYLFFALDLEKNHYTRTQLADITREINLLFHMPAMMLIRHNGALTFSIIDRRLHKKDQSRDVLEKVKLIKDIRYQDPHRAHIEILHDLALPTLMAKHECRDFKQLHEAWRTTLDTNELNKKFYRELADWYFWAIDHVEFPADAEKHESTRNATSVIRLLTRLIFCWFLKEKGLILADLFSERKLSAVLNSLKDEDSSFYRAILQNLFFGTLNQRMNTGGRDNRRFANDGPFLKQKNEYGVKNLYRYQKLFAIAEEEAVKLFSDIPFLNGGLFDCLDKEDDSGTVVYVDGFTRNARKQPKVPNFLFFSDYRTLDLSSAYGDRRKKKEKVRGLINLLDSYKFTVTENTPIEEEIALDPELLGKVFENLLASYNPETGTTARKQTGSFYTPREIVNYMVDESLIAYLEGQLKAKVPKLAEMKDLQDLLREVFAYTEKAHPFDEQEVEALIDAIDTCNILDPACGSGAFPMGILHKLVFILRKLDPKNERWKQKQLDKLDSVAIREELERIFENNDDDYGRKLYLIENCIYGVDIQPIAIQIAKLRFFISLICDQRANKNKTQNCGVRPLPNLETKFVAANTLISLNIGKGQQLSLTDPLLPKLERELAVVRHKHFAAQRRRDKLALQKRDAEIRKEIAGVLAHGGMSGEAAHRLAAWDPYDQNTSAPFFDVEWMYGITDGFNVVIGNPPYVQIQKFSGKQEQKDWEKQRFSTYVKTGDVYSLFYERGNMLLRDNGILVFITSNKWMRANYGKKTRKYFLDQVNIQKLIDFGDSQIFENATTYTNILIFSKGKDGNQSQVWDLSEVYETNTSLEAMLSDNKGCASLFSEDSFVIVPMEQAIVKKRIEAMGTPLKNWDVSIYRGVLTGFNEAFIVDRAKKDELIAADPKNAEIIKPILRGRDIKRYHIEFADLWLINTHNGYQGSPPIRIDDYPAIKVHLDHYWNKLKKRQDKGVTPYNLRNCAYLPGFEKEKIVWPETSLSNFLCIDKKGFFLDKTCFFMVPSSKYLLALVNSKVAQFYLSLLVSKMRGGYFSMSKIYVEKVPIIKLLSSKQLPFESLVDCTLFAKEHNMESEASTLESVIDGMVYDLYFEEEMKSANCYITGRITEVIKPFKDDDTDDFKKQYIEKLVKFCNEDKTVYRGLIYRRTVKVVKIVTGAKK